ncbi:MAG: hypothetical protein IPH02_16685 [Sphingobacteriales bacterium]|nr:hypothetical protein [Sphingobacteriales bacterium]
MFAQIPLPAVPCRAAPSEPAEMTNQLLFGELDTIADIAPQKTTGCKYKACTTNMELGLMLNSSAFFSDRIRYESGFIKTQSVLNLTHYSSKPFLSYKLD